MQRLAQDHNSSGLPSSSLSSLAREERGSHVLEDQDLDVLARTTAWECASDQAQLGMALTVWRRPSQSMPLSMACQSLTDTPAMDDGFRVPIVVASAIQRNAKQLSTCASVPVCRYMAP